MSLEVNIGKRRNILEVGPENADQVVLLKEIVFFFFEFMGNIHHLVEFSGYPIKSCA